MNEEQFVNLVSQMLLNTGYTKTRDALLEEAKTHGFKINKKEMPSIEIKSSYSKSEDSEDSTAELVDKEVRGSMTNVCSRCGVDSIYPTKYCGNCGISMCNGY